MPRFEWNIEAAPLGAVPIYVAVSGNTGAGKSRLLESIAQEAATRDLHPVVADEGALHHPLLRLMFANPGEYGFPVQLNFLLQRYLLIKRAIESNRLLVIERGHLDDRLFAETLHAHGYISPKHYALYQQLSSALAEDLPEPDIVVYLEVPPEVSLERITSDERRGGREIEFPSDAAREMFVRSWFSRYRSFWEWLESTKRAGKGLTHTTIMRYHGSFALSEAAKQVVAAVLRVRQLKSFHGSVGASGEG